MMSSRIEETVYLRRKHVCMDPSSCTFLLCNWAYILHMHPWLLHSCYTPYTNSTAPVCCSFLLTLLPHLPCYTLRSLSNVSSRTKHVHISFLERHKLTSSNLHSYRSFSDTQEAKASTVCILEIHKYGKAQSAIGTVTDITAFAHM